MIGEVATLALRIFYRFAANAIIVVKDNHILGILFKQEIEASQLDNIKEATDLPIKPLETDELYLEVFDELAIDTADGKMIPITDIYFQNIDLWSKEDLSDNINSPSKVDSVHPKIFFVQADVSDEEQSALMAEDDQETVERNEVDELEDLEKEFLDIQQQQNLILPQRTMLASESTEPIREHHIDEESEIEEDNKKSVFSNDTRHFIDRELTRSKLSVLTLQTLPFALLALDKSGTELFLNEDWFNLRKTYGDNLSSKPLLNTAKDIIAERVLSQNENEFSAFELKEDIKDFCIFCRPIKEEISTDSVTISIVGYLFWAEKVKKTNRSKQIEKMDVLRANINSNYRCLSQSYQHSSFDGKTLPDILAEQEKKVLLWALEQAAGNKTDAAMLIGIPRQTFSYKLNKHLKNEGRKNIG